MKRKHLIILVTTVILLAPLWMWLAWRLTPYRKLTVAIVDKTAADRGSQEHMSLDWVLNQQRFSNTSRHGYEPSRDYFGFFPGNDRHYRLKGLERFSNDDIDRLSADADLVYIADTYGVYTADWYANQPPGTRSSLIYGGMSGQDLRLLRSIKARHKLAIAEFNSIGSPTPDPIRHEFEALYGMKWTGWTARYYPSFDTLQNTDLPPWLIGQYKSTHNDRWPFHRSGIAWVHTDGRVVITEDSAQLYSPLPQIEATAAGEQMGLPSSITYPFWFDVVDPGSVAPANRSLADFVTLVNDSGLALLARNGIPRRFPAVLRHMGPDYRFYYFSGDFCDNPIGYTSSCFKGIELVHHLGHSSDPLDRTPFFWTFYLPLVKHILEDEYRLLGEKAPDH
ncbi:MAG: hypothetical protein JST42_01250 [Bacteroidetes bacterium]|nr:hypothetical protein [Bacteroidota bacterium]